MSFSLGLMKLFGKTRKSVEWAVRESDLIVHRIHGIVRSRLGCLQGIVSGKGINMEPRDYIFERAYSSRSQAWGLAWRLSTDNTPLGLQYLLLESRCTRA